MGQSTNRLYESFYGFRRPPFRSTSEPRIFFASASHKRCLAYLRHAYQRTQGCVVITGQAGVGKTTILLRYIDSLIPDHNIVATISAAEQTDSNILNQLAGQWLGSNNDASTELSTRIENFVIAAQQRNKRLLVFIDDAHELSERSLNELSNINNLLDARKLSLQCILSGEEQLIERVSRSTFQYTKPHLVTHTKINPMTERETREYMEYRLIGAGWQNDPLIDESVFREVFQFSRGLASMINLLSNRLLIRGIVEEKHQIEQADARNAVRELTEEVNGTTAFELPFEVSAAPQTEDDKIVLANYTEHNITRGISAINAIKLSPDEGLFSAPSYPVDSFSHKTNKNNLSNKHTARTKTPHYGNSIDNNHAKTTNNDVVIKTNAIGVHHRHGHKHRRNNRTLMQKIFAQFKHSNQRNVLLIGIALMLVFLLRPWLHSSDGISVVKVEVLNGEQNKTEQIYQKMDSAPPLTDNKPKTLTTAKARVTHTEVVTKKSKTSTIPELSESEFAHFSTPTIIDELVQENDMLAYSASLEPKQIPRELEPVNTGKKTNIESANANHNVLIKSNTGQYVADTAIEITNSLDTKEKSLSHAPQAPNTAESTTDQTNEHTADVELLSQSLSTPPKMAAKEEKSKQVVPLAALMDKPPVKKSVIPVDELDFLLSKFKLAYESGNLQQFLSIFSKNVKSDEGNSRQVIENDYRKLFNVTDMRKIIIRDVIWYRDTDDLRGKGNFQLSIRERGGVKVRTYTGKVSLSFREVDSGYLITRLNYRYDN